MEWAHGTLKQYLHKIKKEELYPYTPQNYLNHALFILNLKNVDIDGHAVAKHFWPPHTLVRTALVRREGPRTSTRHGPIRC